MCESDYVIVKSKVDRNFTLTQKLLQFSKDNFYQGRSLAAAKKKQYQIYKIFQSTEINYYYLLRPSIISAPRPTELLA